MRQVTRKGLMTVAAATGVIAAAGGTAQAHSGAGEAASNSPGVLSGNTVQAPVHVPVNACGNTIDVVGVLNPAAGNTCVNRSVDAHGGYGDSDGHGGYGDSGRPGGAHSGSHASNSPGVGSGNHVEVPVYAPVNVCGNSVDVVGIGNGTTGDDCANGGAGRGWEDGGGRGGGHNPPGTGHEQPPGGQENPGGPPGGPDDGAHPEGRGNPDDRGNPGGSVDRPGSGTPGHTPDTSGRTYPAGTPSTDLPGTRSVSPPSADGLLAATGAELPLGLALPLGAGAVLAGAVLYRRARASA
ncbi:chaplin [Streptomyces sp. NPDC048002]|uniref:chaplin n=1 Tax=Streptomyces sp. NPDC048002 TaxID=3154344 RepID=UPI0033E5CCE5